MNYLEESPAQSAFRRLRPLVAVTALLAMVAGRVSSHPPVEGPAAASSTSPSVPSQRSPEAQELIRRGFDLLARKEVAQAEAAFRQALEVQPDWGEAHRGLGVALWEEGKAQGALRELVTSVELDPGSAEAHYSLANLAWNLSREQGAAGRPKSSRGVAGSSVYLAMALAEMKKAATLRPGDFGTRLSLASLYMEEGQPQKAAEEAGEVESLARTPSERGAAHLALAHAELAQGDQARAESEYQATLAADPSSGEAHFGLGQLRLAQSRIPQAAEEFRECIRLTPNYAPAYSALAEILLQKGQADEVRGLLTKAVALDPRDWRSTFRLAGLLEQGGQVDRAAEMLREVLTLAPDFLPAREQLGVNRLRRGDLAGAAADAEAMVAADPQAPEGHRLMALVFWKKRDYESSLAECALGLAGHPDSASLLALQSLALWQLDRKKESRAAFVQAAKLEPRLGTAEVFCRLIVCDLRDIGPVEEFLRKNHWLLVPQPSP